jgi:cholesterol transport system auxiliary component
MTRTLLALLAGAGWLASCANLQPQPAQERNTYLLEARTEAHAPHPPTGRVIEIAMPRARAGFDTDQMAYTRRPGEIEYFARNRWADTPAHMLAPALAQAVEGAGAFRAVVRDTDNVHADLRLEPELVRLQQNFGAHPSRIELAVRVTLVDPAAGGVIAAAQFDEVEDAASDDAYGGVMAADRALSRLAARVADYCTDQASNR